MSQYSKTFCLLVFFSFLIWEPVSADSSRPNILWVTCEDISAHLGCYGDPHAITPHLDQLATEGTVYENTYSVAGVCAPTRSCIISGMYPSSIGSHHMRSNAVLSEPVKCFTRYLREAGYYCSNNVKTDYNFKYSKEAWDESSKKAHWRNRKDKEQPFFAVFNFTVTHESKVRADKQTFEKLTSRLTPEQRQDANKLELPPYYPDTPRVRNDWKQLYELITVMDAQVGDILQQLEEDGYAENTIVVYYSDHGDGLPRRKRWLYDSGLHVPMIVRWPGQLQPGTRSDRLVSFIDLAPTMLSIAGIDIPEYLQGHAFLGAQETPARKYIYGARDRMDERYEIIRAVRDQRFKYIRNYEPFRPYAPWQDYGERGPTKQEIRRLQAAGQLTGPQKFFDLKNKPIEELYDTEQDPHEIHNLAEEPAFQKKLAELRQEHRNWMLRTRDLGLIPEGELETLKLQGGMYAVARNEEINIPFETLRTVATLYEQGPSAESSLQTHLQHDFPAVRYWAVRGLGRLEKPSPQSFKLIVKATTDSSPSVQVAAAEALVWQKQFEEARPVLARLLTHDLEMIRTMASSVIDDLGEEARPLIPEMKEAMKRKDKYVDRLLNHRLNNLLGTRNKVN